MNVRFISISILLSMAAIICHGVEQESISENITPVSVGKLVDGYNKSLSWQESVSMRIVADIDSNDNDLFPQTLDYIYRRDSDSNLAEWLGRRIIYDKNNEPNLTKSSSVNSVSDGNMFADILGDNSIGMLNIDYKKRLRSLNENPNYGGPLWGNMYGSDYKSIVDLLFESHDLRIYEKKENVSGIETSVVEGTSKYGKVTVWIAPEKGYAAMQWIIEKEPHHLFDDKTISEKWPTIEKWQVIFNVKQLHEIVDEDKTVFIPKLAHFRFIISFNDGSAAHIDNFEYRTSDIQLKPDFEALGAFKIELMEGASVFVQGDRYAWSKDKKFVGNKHDGSIMYVPKDWQPIVNIGEALPSFRDFNVELSQSETQNKMILLCFFDYEQRPSRNCITQLSKRAQELRVKDIEIAAVQTSKIEQEILDGWIKENNISFTIGMIKNNEEETRFKWGVQSVPWLILTDKNHIVTDEGFSINELDEKINKR